MAKRQNMTEASCAGRATAVVATMIAGLVVANLAMPSSGIERPRHEPGSTDALEPPIDQVERQTRSSLAAAASQAAAMAPIRVNAATTLVGAVVSGRRLVYYLSVSRNLPDPVIDDLRVSAAPAIRKAACTMGEKRELIGLGAKLSYRFRFPSGREFVVTVADCAEGPAT